MPPLLITLLLVLAAYLLGSVSFALVASRVFGLADPRSYGSKNIGATNVLRTGHKGAALFTLLGDAGKGWLAVFLAIHYAPAYGLADFTAGLVALAVFFGHLYPIFLGFKGGKGVATAAGAFLAIAPLPTLVAVGIFGLVFAAFKVVSLGSLAASLALVVSTTFLDGRPEVIGLAALVATLVFVRHRANIRRLWRGEESKFKSAQGPS